MDRNLRMTVGRNATGGLKPGTEIVREERRDFGLCDNIWWEEEAGAVEYIEGRGDTEDGQLNSL